MKEEERETVSVKTRGFLFIPRCGIFVPGCGMSWKAPDFVVLRPVPADSSGSLFCLEGLGTVAYTK